MNTISIITACKSTESLAHIEALVASVQTQGDVLAVCEWIWAINGPGAIDLARFVQERAGCFVKVHVLTDELLLGPGAARTIAIQHATGDFICIQDSDDLMLPWRLQRQLEMIREADVDVLYTKLVLFESNEELPALTAAAREAGIKRIGALRLALHCAPRNPSAFIRRRVFEHSSYHPTLRISEDYWLWCHVILNGGSIAESREPLVAYRTDRNFFHRRRGFEYFRSDVLVKTHFLTRWLGMPRVVGLLFSTVSSAHRLLSASLFSLLYRITHHVRH
jgi:glycosyltransferase involved in cell wall biosynthesis